MSEREMLERAAAAAGYVIEYWAQDDYPVVRDGDRKYSWNPLVFDSDALRLAVRRGIGVQCHVYRGSGYVLAQSGQGSNEAHVVNIEPGDDPCAATRLAITRAAAALAPTAQGE